jgi:polysaccharide biosynthesis transport protein
MTIIDFTRLIRKHIVLLIVVPLFMAALVILLTSKPKLIYASQTVLYTGLATGSSIEMDKSFNYFVTSTAFDNLINIINSRETQQEVAIRLLSQHLMLQKADPKYISQQSLDELRKIVPAYVNEYVVTTAPAIETVPAMDSTDTTDSAATAIDEEQVLGKSYLFPDEINYAAYEATVRNLTHLMHSSDTNFVYALLNYDNPHYSIEAISDIKAIRMANSDLIKLSYETDDPGICQQTLAIFNAVCIKNYKSIRENRSDEVVKYFEQQLSLANAQLKKAEDNLLAFNKSNNIINYYEQSKAVAVVKEDMEVDYNNKKAQLAGLQAGIDRLEDKLSIQQQVQLKSTSVLDKKKQLGDINYEIAMAEATANQNSSSAQQVPVLKKQAETLKQEIRNSVDELYSYQNTVDGLPVNEVLTSWINNVIEAENLKAKLMVMDQRNRDFQQQYSVYAPAGANIKRIEREIAVSEQGYLEILHGLNLAKLKLQDSEMSSNLKAVDPPFYPLTANPTKRKVLVVAAALIGGLLVLGIALLMEYFDDTLRNLTKATKMIGLPAMGVFPKVLLNPGNVDLNAVLNRVLGLTTQQLEQTAGDSSTKTVVFLSTMDREGKTTLAGNIARRLLENGKQVILMSPAGTTPGPAAARRLPLLHRLLGYSDPRVNTQHPVLAASAGYLPAGSYHTYSQQTNWCAAADYTDLLSSHDAHQVVAPDYVFIELPALLHHNYPAKLVSNADLSVLVCRSNRTWSEADKRAVETLQAYGGDKLKFILNGVALQEVESVIGELPKQRTKLRRSVKNMLRLQFYSNNQI